MNTFAWLKCFFEYIGGSQDEPPPKLAFLSKAGAWRGIWWSLLAAGILLFCGQTSKFIYIDF